MPKEPDSQPQVDLLQGTLDMLIMRTLLFGPAHGHRIAHSIKNVSQDVLYVDHGSLYPALQRLERRGWIGSSWGTSENNRRAKYYKLTTLGRKQLNAEASKWERLVGAITRIMVSTKQES